MSPRARHRHLPHTITEVDTSQTEQGDAKVKGPASYFPSIDANDMVAYVRAGSS